MNEKHTGIVNEVMKKYFTDRKFTQEEYDAALNVAAMVADEMENETDALTEDILGMKYTIRTLLTGNEMLSAKLSERFNDENLNA